MAHNSKVFGVAPTDGVTTITSANFVALDNNGYVAVNGDAGGSWSPTAKIAIGGFGIGGYLPSAEWWTFGADAGSKRTISRVVPVTPVQRLLGANIVSLGFLQGLGTGSMAIVKLLDGIPHGATITSITCRVLIKNSHVTLPTTFPMMSVHRIDEAAGGIATFLKSTDAGIGVNEYFVGAPVATAAAYNALGAVPFTYTPDQNNVIDRTLYTYSISLFDENGGGAIFGNVFYAFKVTFTVAQFEVA